MIKIKKYSFNKIPNEVLDQWNFVIDNSKEATIYHSPKWIESITKEVGINCDVLIALKENKPVGVFPYYIDNFYFLKKAVTNVFETPYGGPISIDDANYEILGELLKSQDNILELVKSTIILPPFAKINYYKGLKFKSKEKGALVVDLYKSEDELWSDLHKMKKRNINKAIKNELTISDSSNEHLEDFHEMISATYKRLNLSPPKPLKFYRTVFGNLEPEENIKLLTASYKGIAIASIILLLFNDTVIFWQGASYKDYMKYAPNDYLHWNAMKESKGLGYKYYNFLHYHGSKGEILPQLKEFKERFGAIEVPYFSCSKYLFPYSILK